MRRLLATLLMLGGACTPLERIERGTESIWDALRGCSRELTEADILECGERVLDQYDTPWECGYVGESDTWEVCGTREDIEALAATDSQPGTLRCDRVGATC